MSISALFMPASFDLAKHLNSNTKIAEVHLWSNFKKDTLTPYSNKALVS